MDDLDLHHLFAPCFPDAGRRARHLCKHSSSQTSCGPAHPSLANRCDHWSTAEKFTEANAHSDARQYRHLSDHQSTVCYRKNRFANPVAHGGISRPFDDDLDYPGVVSEPKLCGKRGLDRAKGWSKGILVGRVDQLLCPLLELNIISQGIQTASKILRPEQWESNSRSREAT